MFGLKGESWVKSKRKLTDKTEFFFPFFSFCFLFYHCSATYYWFFKNMNKRKENLGLDQSDTTVCGYILTVLTAEFHRQQYFFSVLYLKITAALKWSESWVLTFWWITSSPEAYHCPFSHCTSSHHKETLCSLSSTYFAVKWVDL